MSDTLKFLDACNKIKKGAHRSLFFISELVNYPIATLLNSTTVNPLVTLSKY